MGALPAAHAEAYTVARAHTPAGAKTPLANLFCGLLVGFVLLVLCPVFEKIPMNVLGAVIIVGCAGRVLGASRCAPSGVWGLWALQSSSCCQ